MSVAGDSVFYLDGARSCFGLRLQQGKHSALATLAYERDSLDGGQRRRVFLPARFYYRLTSLHTISCKAYPVLLFPQTDSLQPDTAHHQGYVLHFADTTSGHDVKAVFNMASAFLAAPLRFSGITIFLLHMYTHKQEESEFFSTTFWHQFFSLPFMGSYQFKDVPGFSRRQQVEMVGSVSERRFPVLDGHVRRNNRCKNDFGRGFYSIEVVAIGRNLFSTNVLMCLTVHLIATAYNRKLALSRRPLLP